MVTVSLKGVATVFQPVDDGRYLVLLKDSTVGRNRANTGNAYKMTLDIVEGPAENPDPENKGRKLFVAGSLEHDNLMYFKRAVKALGADESVWEADDINVKMLLDDLKARGRETWVNVTKRKSNNGTMQNVVAWILPEDDLIEAVDANEGGVNPSW